jgi:hypothetical protein
MKAGIDATEIDSLEVPGLGLATKGLAVQHPLFGHGKIVALFRLPIGGLTSHSIGIEFTTVGYKALAPEYAKLSRASA